MSIGNAILLGLIQGIAEFLPISSSGHLVLLKDVLGLGDVPLLFDVLLHLATLLAVVLVFRKRIGGILAALWRWLGRRTKNEDQPLLRLVPPLLIATVLTGIIGFGISSILPDLNARLVSGLLLVTAAFLIASSFFKPGKRGYNEMRFIDGVFIGIAQGLGVFPGISRSGITITAGLGCGLAREEAGEFSFLLSIPAILGAFILELKDATALGSTVQALPLLVAALVAFGSGVLALRFLMGLVKRGKLGWFAAYLIPLGLAGLFLL